jgi:hypothetical protein
MAGYVQGEVMSARNLIDPLLEVFQIDVVEDGGLLRFRSRARASRPSMPLPVLADLDGEPLWRETRGHDSDFAAEAMLTFSDPDNDYEQASARSRRAPSASNRVLRYDLVAVLPEEAALAAAEGLLRDNRVSRRSVSFSLPPTAIGLQPGDVVFFERGPQGRFLVARIEDGATRKVEAREFASATGGAVAVAESGRKTVSAASSVFSPLIEMMDLPRLSAAQAPSFACAAVYASPWRSVVLSASPTTQGYTSRSVLDRPARIGALVSGLGAGVSGRFDRAQLLELDLPFGGLSSAPKISVLNGGNAFALRSAAGTWEIGAFLEAEEIAAGRWRLTGLLRGLAGTEDAMAAGGAAGAPIVFLDEAVRPLNLASSEMGLTLNWIAEAAASDGRAGPLAFAGGIRAETPLSPVHLRGRRRADGSAEFAWIRRGRLDSDNWIAADIPLDEPTERYRIAVLAGAAVVREVEVTSAAWVYSAGDELADFGSAQTALSLRIAQMGQRVPLGIAATAVVAL